LQLSTCSTNALTSLLSYLRYAVCISFLVLMERFILGLAQTRVGPRVVGLFGLLQTLVDGGKLFLKKVTKVDLLAALSFFSLSMIAVGLANGGSTGWLQCLLVLAALSLSLFVVCLKAASTYSLIAAYRGVLMTISFDVAIRFFLIVQMFMVHSRGLLCLLLFKALCLLELGRTPFDLVERESELVSGYNIEYAGFGFTLLFLREYMRFYWIFGLMGEIFVTYFILVFVAHNLLIAVRGVLPRYKYYQVLTFSWGVANLAIFFLYTML